MGCKKIILILLLIPASVFATDLDRLGCSDDSLAYKIFGQWGCIARTDISGGGSSCSTDDQVPIGNGSSATCTSIPDSDGTTQKLQYDVTTNAFSAGTDQVGYDEICDEGSCLTKRAKINCTGTAISCEDDSGNSRTNITVQSSGGEGPPWGNNIRHYAYLKFSQTSQTNMNWGGGVADFAFTRTSSAGTLSVTPTKKHVYTNTTITSANHGYTFLVAGNQGYIKWNYRPVVHYRVAVVDATASDSTSYKGMFGITGGGFDDLSLCTVANPIRNCTNGSSTLTSGGAGVNGGLWACWDKGAQTNIQCCRNTENGAGNSTQVCTDTGIAAPGSNVEVDVVLDFLDSSNAACWIGVAGGSSAKTTVTGNLPTAMNQMVQKSMCVRTTAAPSDLEMIVYNAEEWWD